MEALTKPLEELGTQIKENIPKIKLGDDRPIDDPLIDKIKRWLLIGLVTLVAGGAVVLIIKSLIGKFGLW